jgi:hypothetical protein
MLHRDAIHFINAAQRRHTPHWCCAETPNSSLKLRRDAIHLTHAAQRRKKPHSCYAETPFASLMLRRDAIRHSLMLCRRHKPHSRQKHHCLRRAESQWSSLTLAQRSFTHAVSRSHKLCNRLTHYPNNSCPSKNTSVWEKLETNGNPKKLLLKITSVSFIYVVKMGWLCYA